MSQRLGLVGNIVFWSVDGVSIAVSTGFMDVLWAPEKYISLLLSWDEAIASLMRTAHGLHSRFL